jgi:hypothetical protein
MIDVEVALALAGLAVLVGVPFWFATRRPKKRPSNWGDAHNPAGESTNAVQAGYDVRD